MKRLFFSAVFIVFIFTILSPVSAAAEDSTPVESWDACVQAFLAENNCPEWSVALGYYNTVTGEEHYYRGDIYMETGSIYKVPLNMLYAERIHNGEMSFDTPVFGIPYETQQQATLIRSDNYYATLLWQNLGSYMQFRDLIAPYMGVDPATADPLYYENRLFTAQQVIHCLRILYEDPERFPGVIDCLLQAEPEDYFFFHEQQVPIAHKYGYISENGSFYVCDCGICYTDDPILIVMFTWDVRLPNNLLADYCTLMCDYADHTRTVRLAAEAAAEPELPSPSPALPAGEPEPDTGPSLPEESVSPFSLSLLLFLGALCICVLAALLLLSIRKKARLLPALLAFLLVSAASAACILGQTKGLLFTRTEGDPQETVTLFFDRILEDDWVMACSCLTDYSSLGFDQVPEDPAEAALYEALQASYAYSLSGDCAVSGLNAAQLVRFTYLDLPSLSEDLQAQTAAAVQRLVEELPAGQIYDGQGGYRDDFISRAYLDAVHTVLSRPEPYLHTVSLSLELYYAEDGWKLSTSPALLNALSGGTAS